MLLRRLFVPAVALATAIACSPSVDHTNPPAFVDYAVFDPTAAPPAIPLPNDLALQQAASQTGAQGELLQSFVAAGGFPNDQEVAITVDFVRQNIDSAGKITNSAPDLDLATLKAGTLFAVAVSPAGVPEDPGLDTAATTYVKGTDKGTLTLHHKANTDPAAGPLGSRRWKAGFQYVVALRGGASGVKTVAGGQVNPQSVTFLITQGKDLSLPQNQSSLPGTTASERAAAGAQLELLRRGYLDKGVFTLIGTAALGGFPVNEVAVLQTFKIAPAQAGAAVVVDPSAGVVPLPSDLLLDPSNGGKTIVNNAAFGPLAAGIATLDGFSTTAMVLSQTSAPIVAATVKGAVFLYDLSNPAAPARLKEIAETAGAGFSGAAYVAEPFQITQKPTGPTTTVPCTATDDPTGCFSTAIGLQPAVGAPVSPTVQINLPPLKEGTEYAVLVTDGVLAAPTPPSTTPTALKASSLSKVLLFQNPLADLTTGKGLLPGQSDAQAVGLEQIRRGVGAAAAALQAEKGIAKSHIVLGYTFRTQKITDTALKLAAAPYQSPALFVPGTPVNVTAAFPAFPAAQEVLSVPVPTLNPIDPATGALNPDSTKWTPASLSALVVVPVTAGTPASPAHAPLVVFQHGLGRSKSDVAAIANTLAGAGFVVASIDAPLHGDRSYCVADSECVCPGGGTGCAPKCNLFPAGAQGDAVSGTCSAGSVPEGPSATPQAISGRFFVSANFFRTRDALRQDILDTSALVLALAPLGVPSNPLAAELVSKGVAIDPTKVYWIGQSLGGILGTLNTAADPRISRAVLNVPGGTLVDVFTQSPSFSTQVNALLASLTPPIVPGTPQFLQFIQVAKLVIDGAEPLNFGGHLVGDAAHPTLPDLLQSKPNQAAKSVFGQYAICDQVIPNPFNLLLFGEIGLTPGAGPDPFTAYTVAGAGTPGACTAAASNPAHGFLLNGVDPTATAAGQADAAGFLLNLAIPAATRP